ncbi:hypothetical protein MRY87_00800 [bacterium]|nr:hypothetical protein [bacterium]
MRSDKIEQFLKLADQPFSKTFEGRTAEDRALGAQLLLSEVLEYVIHGLGVIPHFQGTELRDPNGIQYAIGESPPDRKEMLDGLADVAYTMFWNKVKFGIPLEEAFELVCDNNLSKFVHLSGWSGEIGALSEEKWDLGMGIEWPSSVATVTIVHLEGEHYAVGKDQTGKVRKPSSYRSVDLSPLLS